MGFGSDVGSACEMLLLRSTKNKHLYPLNFQETWKTHVSFLFHVLMVLPVPTSISQYSGSRLGASCFLVDVTAPWRVVAQKENAKMFFIEFMICDK